MTDKFKNVCDFYATTHKLKTLIRTGWVKWQIDAPRLESVAEHIYGTLMLAFAVNSEFELNLNIEKVIFMLAFHELGETIVGDITPHDGVSKEEKHKLETNAVKNILSALANGQKVIDLFDEFEEQKTKEAIFAHLIDKLECDFQVKCYDETGCANFELQQYGTMEEIRQKYKQKGDITFSQMWIHADMDRFQLGELYNQLCEYILSHKIFD